MPTTPTLISVPRHGIASIITRDAITRGEGNPQADFYLNLAGGVMALPWRGPELPLVIDPAPYKGMHGYFPEAPEMRATFVISGHGLAKTGSLGEVDMRDIAQTLAKIIKVDLPKADGKPLF